MMIIPALLYQNFSDFQQQLGRVEGIFDLVQIDVMDGIFVNNKSFADIEKINGLNTQVKFEVHLMVDHPLQEIEKWLEIKNLERIIFHIESKDSPNEIIAKIRGACKQVGVAINPETPLAAVQPYLDKIDELLFMTVNPGRQGAPFLPEVGEKIKQFNNQLINQSTNKPAIAVDGGISQKNIAEIKAWGAEIFCVGSAITLAEDVKKAYNNLKQTARPSVWNTLISIFKKS